MVDILIKVGLFKNHNYFLKISKKEKEEANRRRKKFRSLRNFIFTQIYRPQFISENH